MDVIAVHNHVFLLKAQAAEVSVKEKQVYKIRN